LTGARVIERTMASAGRLAAVRPSLAGARGCAAGEERSFRRNDHARVPGPTCVARRRRRLVRVASSGGDGDVVDGSGEDTAGTLDGSMGDGRELRHPFEDSGEPHAASALLPGGDFGAAAADASEDASLASSSPSLAPADPAYGSAVGASPPSARITPFQNAVLNVGLASTAVLCALGVKRLVAFVNGIPDLPEEERLRRMAAFCDAQLSRVRETPYAPGSPGADRRDAELARLTEVRADIARKMEKFQEAERRRREWNKRLRRLDERGAPMGARPGSHPGEPLSQTDAQEVNVVSSNETASSVSPDAPPGRDADGFDANGFGAGLRSKGERQGERAETSGRDEEASRQKARDAPYDTVMEKKAAPPGASARWVKATDYLQSAVEKTAEGFMDMEGLAPNAPPPPPGAPPPAPDRNKTENARHEGAADKTADTAPNAGGAFSSGGTDSVGVPRRDDPEWTNKSDAPNAKNLRKSDTTQKPPRGAHDAAPAERQTRAARTSSPLSSSSPPRGKISHPDAVFDGGDDFRSAPGMTPEKAEAVAREIQRLEQMYGDDRSISAEDLDEMCMRVIEKYGLADGKFTKDELYDPRDDVSSGKSGEKSKPRHVSEDDPFYWRKLRAVFPIFEADPATKDTRIMTMVMTHPGLPAYLPNPNGSSEKVKPEPKKHAVAFESRDDAERFVWFMRATRGAESSEGICTTQAMPPSLVQKTADAEGLGVTVIGSGRVDLSPGRRDADVLGDMREIGGEQSLWEFAQWTRRELEEARKPPPPTISY
jgi:hypothetical protein